VSRGPRRLTPIIVVVGVVLALLLASAWTSSRAVFFVGADDEGFVTVFNGVPYELPGGVALYSPRYESGLPLASLNRSERALVAAHKWRSQGQALAFVRRLERETRGPLGRP
jgi:PPM family protein phosphatase